MPGHRQLTARQFRLLNQGKSVAKTALHAVGLGTVATVMSVAANLYASNIEMSNQRNKVDRVWLTWKPKDGKEIMPIELSLTEGDENGIRTYRWTCDLFTATLGQKLLKDTKRCGDAGQRAAKHGGHVHSLFMPRAIPCRRIMVKEIPGQDPMVSLMLAYICCYFADPNGIREMSDPDFPGKPNALDVSLSHGDPLAMQTPRARSDDLLLAGPLEGVAYLRARRARGEASGAEPQVPHGPCCRHQARAYPCAGHLPRQ